MAITAHAVIEFILCILLPPLAIFIHGNSCNIHIAVNVVLCFFIWVPAVLHALWFCFCRT